MNMPRIKFIFICTTSIK